MISSVDDEMDGSRIDATPSAERASETGFILETLLPIETLASIDAKHSSIMLSGHSSLKFHSVAFQISHVPPGASRSRDLTIVPAAAHSV
ncbi:hypothetical protein AXG93_2772s1000 [Marchantia polymorpha subsp. ruderalis]|uniref:Uncharacterized protein n=1 Tax=Marchantia polymorpha subsp. ruderalis TaxID=1480154 RepID=A0A176WI32_MARPO|nr:hypothetical protein AXG93_2772s1000 [Marchantia polymorpha subsp. ruderalis]